jgi:hypothetical protein
MKFTHIVILICLSLSFQDAESRRRITRTRSDPCKSFSEETDCRKNKQIKNEAGEDGRCYFYRNYEPSCMWVKNSKLFTNPYEVKETIEFTKTIAKDFGVKFEYDDIISKIRSFLKFV